MQYIRQITSEQVGGGNIVEFVYLNDGRILGINDECICLYNSMNDFWDASNDIQCIDLHKQGANNEKQS